MYVCEGPEGRNNDEKIMAIIGITITSVAVFRGAQVIYNKYNTLIVLASKNTNEESANAIDHGIGERSVPSCLKFFSLRY